MSMPLNWLMPVLMIVSWIVRGPVLADDTPLTPDAVVAKAMRDLKQGDRRVQLDALLRLGRMGHRSAPAVPELITGLSDRDPAMRAAAALALGQIGGVASASNPALLAALRDSERAVRIAAATA